VDVTGIEPVTACLQSRAGKTLKCFDGVACTDNQQNSRSLNVPKLYRDLTGCDPTTVNCIEPGRGNGFPTSRGIRSRWTAFVPPATTTAWGRCGFSPSSEGNERRTRKEEATKGRTRPLTRVGRPQPVLPCANRHPEFLAAIDSGGPAPDRLRRTR
jgi:hypothetical protein